MRKIAFIFASFLLPLMVLAQNSNDTTSVVPPVSVSTDDDLIFTVVEVMPEFPGGDKARIQFLMDNLKYPKEARKNGIEGVVYVKFVIEKDGSISNSKILRDVGGGLEEEALRVVKMMPKWIPGKQRGKAVRCYITLPLIFSLN